MAGDELREAVGDGDDRLAEVLTGDARGPALFQVDDSSRDLWQVRQVLLDPLRYREWFVAATVDLTASAEAGEIRATFDGVERM